MPTSVRSKAALNGLLIMTVQGCAGVPVAGTDHQWGTGPAPVDLERPILLEEADEVLREVSIPLRVQPEIDRYISVCTVRAGWVNAEGRADLLAFDSTPHPPIQEFVLDPELALSLRRLESNERLPFPADLITSQRLPVLSFGDPPPARQVDDADRGSIPPGKSSLLVEVWLGDAADDTEPCRGDSPVAPPADDLLGWNLYLVDFEDVYPAGAAAVGGGAWVVGVITLTALVGVLVR